MSNSPVCSPNFAFPPPEKADYFSLKNGRTSLHLSHFTKTAPKYSFNAIINDTPKLTDPINKITTTTSDLSLEDDEPGHVKRVCRSDSASSSTNDDSEPHTEQSQNDYFSNDFGNRLQNLQTTSFHSVSHSDTTAEAATAAASAVQAAADSEKRSRENDHIRSSSAIEPCFPFRPQRVPSNHSTHSNSSISNDLTEARSQDLPPPEITFASSNSIQEFTDLETVPSPSALSANPFTGGVSATSTPGSMAPPAKPHPYAFGLHGGSQGVYDSPPSLSPFASTSSNVNISLSQNKLPPHPTIKKQLTSPALSLHQRDLSFNSIKNDQIRRIHSFLTINYKEQIKELSPKIHYHPPIEMNAMLRNEQRNEKSIQLQVQNRLLIDIRPFTDFVQSHLCSSVNLCIPSTLLKRSNFNLQRCINSLPANEKVLIKSFFEVEAPGIIVVYDHNENSSNLYHVCNKFIASSLFDPSRHSIHLVDTSFTQFHEEFPTLFESGTSEMNSGGKSNQFTGTDPSAGYPGAGPGNSLNYAVAAADSRLNNILPPILIASKVRSMTIPDLTVHSKLDFSSAATPILSKFSLPKASMGSTTFKIRHNEELGSRNPFEHSASQNNSPSTSSTLNQNKLNFFKLNNLPADKTVLPLWIRNTLYREEETAQSDKINSSFFALEKLEQARLVNALSLKKETESDPSEECVTISRGIEYGHKNRYKDIFLYEHSRVKLNKVAGMDDGVCDEEDDEDYINASYLNPINNLGSLTEIKPCLMSQLKSVATQGPLEQTMGDFWKCIFNLKTVVIISLTDEIENGVMKCSPFWRSGVYLSNKDTVNVLLHKEYKFNEYLTIRTFQVTMSGESHKVIQMHLISWPDMGTILKPLDLIQILQLKAYILDKVPVQDGVYPTIIHCSAGCGRTGTLCTIDTMLNIFKNNGDSFELKYDPIQDIVNNFRRQRISMVQNLGQYYLIYEIIVEYIVNLHNTASADRQSWDDLCKLEIVDDFVNL